MLVSLSIRSFVLIDCLELEAMTGFTALTGETGAGKSIILDALSLALGGPVNRKLIREGAAQASLMAEFALADGHPLWTYLSEHGIGIEPGNTLTLKRILKRSGPSRSFVNDHAVSADLLATLGGQLVELHGQHAALSLLQTATHRAHLDAFGQAQSELAACERTWSDYLTCRQDCAQRQAEMSRLQARQAELTEAVKTLQTLSPQPGEFETLLARREILAQAEKLNQFIHAAQLSLEQEGIAEQLATAARALSRLRDSSVLQQDTSSLSDLTDAAHDAVERTLIELTEAQLATQQLSAQLQHDPYELETIEDRLMALRAAARRFEVPPEALAETLEQFSQTLTDLDTQSSALNLIEQRTEEAYEIWRAAAAELTRLRHAAAERLQRAVHAELEPLKLERMCFRIAFSALPESASGALGAESVTFEIEANPGSGFGTIQSIASGGELSRFCLALQCALNHAAPLAPTLIFDEIDQGVGGAVASAIGARLSALAAQQQVFAITHSPQVAACAQRQWRVSKQKSEQDALVTRVNQLNDHQRLEEIARMLSGSRITDEARAAASKLLELV